MQLIAQAVEPRCYLSRFHVFVLAHLLKVGGGESKEHFWLRSIRLLLFG